MCRKEEGGKDSGATPAAGVRTRKKPARSLCPEAGPRGEGSRRLGACGSSGLHSTRALKSRQDSGLHGRAMGCHREVGQGQGRAWVLERPTHGR